MTIENNLFTYPLMSEMTFDPRLTMPLSAQIQSVSAQVRTRNHSGGSTGSQGSSGSSSYGSEKSMISLPHELLAHHFAPGTAPSTIQNAATVRRTDRGMNFSGDRSSTPNGHKNVNPARYKTEMCRPFEENGNCKYGDKCQFAHGINELRNLSRHPKYKTELCRTYHTVGFCPYGPRCHFIHNEDELKLTEITHMKHQHVLKQVAQQVAQQQQVLSRMALSHPVQEAPKPMPMCPQMPQSPSCQVPRPKNLDFTHLSLPMSSLGSTIDSPPASVASSSPSLSPTSMMSDDVFSGVPTPPPGFAALPSNQTPPGPGVFSFQDVPTSPPMCAPRLPSPLSITTDSVAALAASLQATSLRPSKPRNCDGEIRKSQLGGLFNGPPTPPLSTDSSTDGSLSSAESPDVPRLPIFSMLSTFTEVPN